MALDTHAAVADYVQCHPRRTNHAIPITSQLYQTYTGGKGYFRMMSTAAWRREHRCAIGVRLGPSPGALQYKLVLNYETDDGDDDDDDDADDDDDHHAGEAAADAAAVAGARSAAGPPAAVADVDVPNEAGESSESSGRQWVGSAWQCVAVRGSAWQ